MAEQSVTVIKKYLPYFQFSAVVLTIVLGVHTALERFVSPHGSVIDFDEKSFRIELENAATRTYQMHFDRKKNRDDCPLSEFKAAVISKDGFTYEVKTSIGKTAGHSNTNSNHIMYMFVVPPEVPAGDTVFTGVLVYGCKEGLQTIYYPNAPGLTFELKK